MGQRVGILGLPFDKNSSYLRGAALAPPKIREAFHSYSSNSWTESGIDLDIKGLIIDAGDLDPDSATEFEDIQAAVSRMLNDSLAVLSLGGDHSVTYPILRSFRKKYSKLDVLHFDAHPDLYHDFEGNPHSHASPFARALEEGLIDRLVQIGIRTSNTHQKEQAKKFGVEMIEMKDFRNDLNLRFDNPLYISVDLDGLDPAYAPGVSHPEPGGLSTRDVVSMIQSVRTQVAGADIVELNPNRDPLNLTAYVCGKLMKEIIAKMI
jgi:agmatinase